MIACGREGCDRRPVPVFASRHAARAAMLRAMTPLPDELILQQVRAALTEDIGSGDVTTLATVPENAQARASMMAREGLVVCGLRLAEAAFKNVSSATRVRCK